MDRRSGSGPPHAFRHLVAKTPYVEALRETLAGGGDTDTNACIVGGLIGALHGEAGVPEPCGARFSRAGQRAATRDPRSIQQATRSRLPTVWRSRPISADPVAVARRARLELNSGNPRTDPDVSGIVPQHR